MSSRRPQPAPDPPRKGFWIDPEDPTKIRYFSGKRWANRTYYREIWEDKEPEGQAVYPVGAGKDGIATAAPRAERKGRSLSKPMRIFFCWWVCLIAGVALGSWIAPALSRNSTAYDWCNRVGIILLNGAVLACGAFALYAVWKDRHKPNQRFLAWMLTIFGIALPALVIRGTWDRLQDALWLQ